jgi:fructosamine-3-kinase
MDPLDQAWQDLLSRKTGEHVAVLKRSSIGGGCINEAFRLDTTAGIFFVKTNHAQRFPGMFEQEAQGLKLLYDAQELRIPEVIGCGTQDATSFLLLEYIDGASMISNFWEDFGHRLARLHQHSNDQFGLDHFNYIGSLNQENTFESSWSEFFVTRRLEPQCKLALDHHRIEPALARAFSVLFAKLNDLFPKEPPSLLHGDLWSGNYMIDDFGCASVFDPAIYYGHREMDLAMTLLFGGFRSNFYDAYQESYPLESDWRKRMDLCNLYPLMVHVNLFGGGYAQQVKNIVDRWI